VLLFCYGELSLKPKELARLVFSDYMLLAEGYQRRELNEWRRVRELMTMIHNTSMTVKNTKTSKELFPLPDEIDEKEKEINEAEFVSLLKNSGAKRNTITAEEAKKLGF
jgi:ubiquinone biosynthesis protein Coq4